MKIQKLISDIVINRNLIPQNTYPPLPYSSLVFSSMCAKIDGLNLTDGKYKVWKEFGKWGLIMKVKAWIECFIFVIELSTYERPNKNICKGIQR